LLAGTQKGNLYRLTPGKPPQAIAIDSQPIYFVKCWQDFFWIGTGSGQLMIMDNEFCLIKALPISTKNLRCMETMENLAWIGCSDAHIYYLEIEDAIKIATEDNKLTEAAPSSDLNEDSANSNVYPLPTMGSMGVRKLKVSNHLANEPSVFGVSAINNSSLISVGRDAHVRLFQDSQLISAVPAHLGTIHGLSKHPVLPWFATGSMDKSIKLWQWEIGSDLSASMQLIKVINRDKFAGEVGHTHSVNSVLWISEEGKKCLREKQNAKNFAQDPARVHWLLSVGDDRQGILWSITQFC
jgi:WD40 repeat protein